MFEHRPRESAAPFALPDPLPDPLSRAGLVRRRFGLRAQLLVALSVLFALSFALLTAASLQLSARSARLQAHASAARLATLTAHRLAALAEPGKASSAGEVRDAQRRLLETLHADLSLASVAYQDQTGQWVRIGSSDGLGGVQRARATVASGGQVRVSVRPAQNATMATRRRLLVFYAALTGGAALLLSFVLLTQLMVRPLERITRVSERLAGGDLAARAPVLGAAEVAVVSASLNRMAEQLRRDRDDLQAQLQTLRATTQTLQRTEDQLAHGEKLASVGRMAAGIAHEVGNPLAAILGLVELLQSDTLSQSQRTEFLSRVHAEVERISEVIRGLLDFSRLDADGTAATPVAMSPLEVAHVVDEAVALVRPLRAARSVAFDVRCAQQGQDTPVLADAAALRQVLVNLLINAVDAMANGGASGRASASDPAKVVIELRPATKGLLRLTVQDSGPGIDPKVRPYLFEPFSTTKPVGRGTGLGLAVAHGLIERMGGTLGAQNSDAGGALFFIDLPLAAQGASSGPHGGIV